MPHQSDCGPDTGVGLQIGPPLPSVQQKKKKDEEKNALLTLRMTM